MNKWLIKEQQLLSRQIQNKNLPHAMLINGVASSGKSALAQWLIEVLLCQVTIVSNDVLLPCNQCKSCLLNQSATYPDHIAITAEKNAIGVDKIRAASHFFEKTAQIGSNKTLLISSAETMTIAAANALLKTLEEPTENSFIILLTTDIEVMLPTIISRCRIIDIRPPVGKQLSSIFSDLNASDASDKFSNLSHFPELNDTNIAEQYQDLQQSFVNFLNQQEPRSILLKKLTETNYKARWLEKIVVNLMRQEYSWLENNLHNNSQTEALCQKKLWSIYCLLLSCNKQSRLYVQSNQLFTLEKMLIDIETING